MFQFPDEVEKNSFEGDLFWLFKVHERENIDKARKNLRIEALNEEEWKRINTVYRSLQSIGQVIEDTYDSVKEKLRKLELDEYIDQLTSAKEDLVEWIKRVSFDLKQKLEIEGRSTGRKGISPDIKTLSQLTELKANIRRARGSIEIRVDSYLE